jgi:hypothetical protein
MNEPRRNMRQRWNNMKARCFNPAVKFFHSYGGRGITVCERWMAFENFLADMGYPPTRQHSLDRIDVNGNYEPGNCRWATQREQANNKRGNVPLTVNGVTRTLAEWSHVTGHPLQTIYARYRRGWEPEKLIGMAHGLGVDAINRAKTHCKRGHPFEGDNLVMRKSGQRQCRTCANLRARLFMQRHREARA